MTTAVVSSSAATYVAPSAAVSAAPAAGTAPVSGTAPAQTQTSTAASPLPAGTPALASDTVAALVAQQADESGKTSSGANGSANAAPQSTLPPAVIANMQAFATTDPTQYTDEINSSAAILADGSTAADSDKLQAWVHLTQLLATGAIYKAGNIADLQKAVSAQNGSYGKHVADVQLQYNQIETRLAAPAQAAGQSVDGYRNQLTALNSFSSPDQNILLATMSAAGQHGFSDVYGWQAFSSVDDWKSALQQEAASDDGRDQEQSASADVSQHPQVSAAPAAPTLLSKPLQGAAPQGGATSASDVALQVITDAAHRTAEQSRPHRDVATRAAAAEGTAADRRGSQAAARHERPDGPGVTADT